MPGVFGLYLYKFWLEWLFLWFPAFLVLSEHCGTLSCTSAYAPLFMFIFTCFGSSLLPHIFASIVPLSLTVLIYSLLSVTSEHSINASIVCIYRILYSRMYSCCIFDFIFDGSNPSFVTLSPASLLLYEHSPILKAPQALFLAPVTSIPCCAYAQSAVPCPPCLPLPGYLALALAWPSLTVLHLVSWIVLSLHSESSATSLEPTTRSFSLNCHRFSAF